MAAQPLHVLIVEDSEDDAVLLVHELERGGYAIASRRVETEQAMRAALTAQPWDVVFSDHSVPQFGSSAALAALKDTGADIPFIIVSGTIGEEQAVAAMKAGASDYLIKGRLARLIPVLERELTDARTRRARRDAERTLREREQQTMLELASAYETTLDGWARALDLRDRETEGHSQRVTDLTIELAQAMGISDGECVHIRRGALLHDIGKMGIPDRVLLKPSALTDEEWNLMRRHPTYALRLLEPISYLQPALAIPYCHHERWDGSGYPRGLRGEDIPLAARVFAVADIWDAVRSDRPYRTAWPRDQALAYIASLAGSHLDPNVVQVFLRLMASRPDDRPAAAPVPDPAPSSRTILVVDDFEANLSLLKRWLAVDGYEVLTARSGEAALALAAGRRPALVLLDVQLPDFDGFEVIRRLKTDPSTRDLPVVLLTAAHADPSAELVADDYLSKPVDAYELRTRVRRILERRAGRP